jgi:hypothetical protein
MKLPQRIILVILTCALIGGTFLLPATGLAQTPGQSRSGRPAVPASATQHGWLETASDVASFWVDKTKKDIDKAIEYISGAKVLVFMVGQTRNAAMTSTFGNDFVQCSSGEQCIGNAIRNGNAFILNLANLFYILLLVVIAIATIFDIPAYNAQKLLPRLIIAIILSNFGLFFVEAIANFAQTLTVGLISDNLGNTLIEAAGVTQHGAEIVTARAAFTIGNILTGGGTVPLQFVYEAINPINWFIVAFILTTIILWLTKAGLWVFAIFAPLGVVAGVLPSTAGIGKKFWQKVVSYAFVAPVLVFFIRLAEIVYEALRDTTPAEQGLNPLYQLKPQEFIAAIGTAIILYIGIIFARKMGVEVANWTLGMAQKAFKGAFGASLALGRFGRNFLGGAITQGLGWKGGLAENLGESYANRIQRIRPRQQQQFLSGALMAGWKNAFLQAAGGKETGVLGQTSKFFGTASSQLTADQKGALNIRQALGLAVGSERASARMQDKEPDFLRQINANSDFMMQRAEGTRNDSERNGILFSMAENDRFATPDENGVLPAGKVDIARLDRLLANNPMLANYLRTKAAAKNILLAPTVRDASANPEGRREEIARLVRTTNMADQSPDALANADVAYAVRTQRKYDLPSLFKKWGDKQKKAIGQGLNKALDSITFKDNAEWRDISRGAVEAGQDPNEVYNALRPHMQSALRASQREGLIQAAVRSPATYRLQRPDVAVRLVSQLTDPSKVDDILSDRKVTGIVKQALRSAAKGAINGKRAPLGRNNEIAYAIEASINAAAQKKT